MEVAVVAAAAVPLEEVVTIQANTTGGETDWALM